MAKKLDQIMAALPAKRRGRVEACAAELATRKDLRQGVAQTREDLVARFPDRPPEVIDHLSEETSTRRIAP